MEKLRRTLFEKAFEEMDRQYDPSEHMVKVPFRSAGYHTTLKGGKVHPNRDSMVYAVALLDSERFELVDRAEAVIRTVVSHQDTDPDHDTYGIWSYHLEEDLATMSPPDWNWADFIGKELLAIVLRHENRISSETRRAVDGAIGHAARSIRRRNMGPHYTNIAIMGTYVTHVYAERYDDADMLEYAKSRLANFVEYTKHNGAFTEFNSPTYNLLATTDIERMVDDFRDPGSREAANWLHDFAWKNIADHYHSATRQWAGPHSRSYRNIQGTDLYTILYLGTDGAAKLIEENEMTLKTDLYRVPLRCPKTYWNALVTPRERQVRQNYVRDNPDQVATTYTTDHYAVGTFYKSHHWNQTRPLIAYWANDGGASCLTARFLHDGYDFCSALSLAVQEKARMLGAVCFATDNGDTHPNLDPVRDETISAEDLRLRFRIDGRHESVAIPEPSAGTIKVVDGHREIEVRLLYGAFAPVAQEDDVAESPKDSPWTVEVDHDAESTFADVVLYHGARRDIRLTDLSRCVVGFALTVDTATAPIDSAGATCGTDVLTLELRDNAATLELTVPVAAGAKADIYRGVDGRIDGKPVIDQISG